MRIRGAQWEDECGRSGEDRKKTKTVSKGYGTDRRKGKRLNRINIYPIKPNERKEGKIKAYLEFLAVGARSWSVGACEQLTVRWRV
jgi:hypothetical protein